MSTPETPIHAPHIQRDIDVVERMTSAPGILEILCEDTGMGFSAVARVDEATWIACSVMDKIGFGLKAGGVLDLHSTLCKEVRLAHEPIAIDRASTDPRYCDHHTPRIYSIESYISVPIVLPDGSYFGNLCAIDPAPAKVNTPIVTGKFMAFAKLIGAELARARTDHLLATELKAEQDNSRLREEFIAVLGHDLRNPLSAIAASAAAIELGGQGVDVRAIAARIRSSSRRMSLLIDDVLDFARGRLGSGIGTRMADETDVEGFLSDVVSETRQAYPEIRIEVSIQNPPSMHCDRSRLQQLLSNLLGNAIHHGTRTAPIQVTGRVEGDEYVLVVSNSGGGIAEESLAKVFQPYWRSANHSNGGGLGLGLHICSQIAKAHGGHMEVKSVAGGLTTFTARLPLAGG